MTRIRTKTGSLAFARYQLNRAILENVLEDNYTEDDRDAALEFFGGCAFCGVVEAPRNEHLVPVIDRGDFVRQNVVPACAKCDDSKGQRDFRSWMREATSKCSLKQRGFTDEQIEERIQRIEQWQAGYESKTDEQLFRENLSRYRLILEKMDNLIDDTQQLVNDVRPEGTRPTAPEVPVSQLSTRSYGVADDIRQFVLDRCIVPARAQGKKSIVIRAGDIHQQMRLHQQYPNVCQVLRGNKLQKIADIQLLSIEGPPIGANTRFTYQL